MANQLNRNDRGFRLRAYDQAVSVMSNVFDNRRSTAIPPYAIVMRSTCLGDANGKEIFELDVLSGMQKHNNKLVEVLFFVEWHSGNPVLIDETGEVRDDMLFDDDIRKRLTVKGNILQSPGLSTVFGGLAAIDRINLGKQDFKTGGQSQKAASAIQAPPKEDEQVSRVSSEGLEAFSDIQEAIDTDGKIRYVDGRWSNGFVNVDSLVELVSNGTLSLEQSGGMSFAVLPKK